MTEARDMHEIATKFMQEQMKKELERRRYEEQRLDPGGMRFADGDGKKRPLV